MIRTRVLTALAAVGVLLAGSLTLAPVARADVGTIPVLQLNAAGGVVCVQDYPVANLSAPEDITDQVCPGATEADVSNDTAEPITVSTNSPAIEPADTQTVPPIDIGIIIITMSLTFNIHVPSGV